MKKLSVQLVGIIGVILFASCEDLFVLNHTTEWSLDQRITSVNVTDEEQNEMTYRYVRDFDLNQYSSYKQWEDKIENIKINKISYGMKSYNPSQNNPETTLSAGIYHYAAEGETPQLIATLDKIKIKDLAESGAKIEIPLDPSHKADIEAYLNGPGKFLLEIDGLAENLPVEYEISLHIEVTVSLKVVG